MAEKFGSKGHWLSACLTGHPHLPYRKVAFWYSSCVTYIPNVTLNDIVGGFKLDRIDLLGLDIEGDEFAVLAHFDYCIRPAMIACEVHSYHDYDRLMESPKGVEKSNNPASTLERNCVRLERLLNEYNYDMYFMESVNPWHEEYPTKELKFISID